MKSNKDAYRFEYLTRRGNFIRANIEERMSNRCSLICLKLTQCVFGLSACPCVCVF